MCEYIFDECFNFVSLVSMEEVSFSSLKICCELELIHMDCIYNVVDAKGQQSEAGICGLEMHFTKW